MSQSRFRTKPDDTESMPPGIPYIVGNEAAERFSFYGMRGILTIFMTEHLRNSAGASDVMSNEEAKSIYHLFVASAYFFPIFGALISDIIWGKYKTILILSLGYCVGHLCLSMGDTGLGAGLLEPRNWLFLGLIFIAVGSGGIKPCVSAHVGDQFGAKNKGLLSKTFSWFYFAINVGAAASNLLTPWLLENPNFGPAYAFGLPGVLMGLATLLFWMGRNRYVHIPPAGAEAFVEETFDRNGVRALANLSPLFLVFVPAFWSLFDQTGSEWVLQATRLDRRFLGIDWYEAQVQAVNPVLVLILIPLFAYIVYPAMGRLFTPTPLRKIGIGLFTAVIAFGLSGWIESRITGGAIVSASSQANRDQWRAIHLIDGDDQTGWLSRPEWTKGQSDAQHEIVIRLRDYQAWELRGVSVVPLPDETELPAPKRPVEGLGANDIKMLRDAGRCRPTSLTLSVADTPEPPDGWEEVVRLSPDQPKGLSAEFGPTVARYAKVTMVGNGGGAYVGLASISLAATPVSADGEPDATIDAAVLVSRPTIGWQFLAYFFLTAAEVMVSIVCLEFAYTQAPPKIKSFIMGVYFLGVSLGNLITAGVNWYIANDDGTSKLAGVAYYQFFTGAMLVSAIGYVIWSVNYRGQTYLQDDEEAGATPEATAAQGEA
ncbi:MAG: POT family MFS transporter [Planctomycetota bacterium]